MFEFIANLQENFYYYCQKKKKDIVLFFVSLTIETDA